MPVAMAVSPERAKDSLVFGNAHLIWEGYIRSLKVCEVFFWRDVSPLFTMTYEPYRKGD